MKKNTRILIVIVALGVLYYFAIFFFSETDEKAAPVQDQEQVQRTVPLPSQVTPPAGIDPRKESKGPTYPPPSGP